MNYEIKSAQGALMLNKNINETTVDMLDSDYKMWLAKRATRQPDPNLCDSDDKFYNRFATRRIENDINVLWPRRGVARKARHHKLCTNLYVPIYFKRRLCVCCAPPRSGGIEMPEGRSPSFVNEWPYGPQLEDRVIEGSLLEPKVFWLSQNAKGKNQIYAPPGP